MLNILLIICVSGFDHIKTKEYLIIAENLLCVAVDRCLHVISI